MCLAFLEVASIKNIFLSEGTGNIEYMFFNIQLKRFQLYK